MKYYTIMLPQCMDQCSIILYHLVGVVSSISKIQRHIVCLNNSHFQIQNMICINSQLFLYLCPECNYKSWLVSQKNMKTSYLSAFASGKNQKMQCVDGKYILKKKKFEQPVLKFRRKITINFSSQICVWGWVSFYLYQFVPTPKSDVSYIPATYITHLTLLDVFVLW